MSAPCPTCIPLDCDLTADTDLTSRCSVGAEIVGVAKSLFYRIGVGASGMAALLKFYVVRFVFLHGLAKNKILNSVVVFYSVNVMHHFRWLQISSNTLLHHKSVFVNGSSVLVSEWMVIGQHCNVSVHHFVPSSRPSVVIFPTAMLVAAFSTTFGRFRGYASYWFGTIQARYLHSDCNLYGLPH